MIGRGAYHVAGAVRRGVIVSPGSMHLGPIYVAVPVPKGLVPNLKGDTIVGLEPVNFLGNSSKTWAQSVLTRVVKS